MRTPQQELKGLRLSVARLAQKLNVDTEALPVLDQGVDVIDLSETKERGWNRLIMDCLDKVDEMHEQIREFGYQE